jgi:small ligand-binding sensory domain FIST
VKEVNELAKAQEVFYAAVGAGDFALEKIRNSRKVADPKATRKLYNDFVQRGQTLSSRIRTSAPAKQAATQTKAARRQVKAAATSVGKAVRANAKAVRSATTKAAKAS